MTRPPWVCGSSLIAAANMMRLRGRLGWSQFRLAEEAGLSPTMVTLLEVGQRNFTLPVLEKIAGALRTSPAAMLSTSGSCGHCAGEAGRDRVLLGKVAALGVQAAGMLTPASPPDGGGDG